ncbi:MAG: leucine-rich repeat protein [Bacteroidales bacterium]|nr:leucine-rich repeat protein [Bacteroidales bacterium]
MTCFGINNEGELVFDYYHEDIDIVNNENVYNGQNSTLWINFRTAFQDRIKSTYQNLRKQKLITFEKFIEYFIHNGSDMWSASVYNEDSDYKYISMLKSNNDASNLYQVRGTGEEHLKYFIENRINYCDSKWYAEDYADDYVALRVYTPTTWAGVEPNPSITVTPFSNMYAGVRYKANGTLLQERAVKNVPVTFTPPSGTDLSYSEDFSDTESAIYGASQISSLGDLAPLYCGTLNVSKATKLINLKIGDSTEGYVNEHLHSLSIGTNKLLKTINVCNCPKLTSELALAECPNIEEIYATGSGITGVALPNSGFLKIVQLPSTITSLVLKNQFYIEELSLEGYNSVETLWIENCPTIDELELFNNCSNVKRVRLTGVNWSFDDTSFLYSLKERGLYGIDENNTNTANAWIDGTCHIKTLNGSEMAELNILYPYLKITYDNLTTQLIFMSEDGTTELTRQTIVNGGDGTCPVTNGTISKPTKSSTAQYSYTFCGWSRTIGGDVASTALKNVTADRYVYAAFAATVRTYTVKFYSGSTLLQTVKDVPYGGTANYTGSTPVKTDVTNAEDYEFKGWNPSNIGIVGETSCYAEFKYVGYVYTSLIEKTLSGEYTNKTVETIGAYAMYEQYDLTGVEFTKATRVEEYAFANCNQLSTVDFDLLDYIGANAFDGCEKLNKIILRNTEKVCDLHNISAFGESNTPVRQGTASIYVPASLIESYKSTSPWNQLNIDMFKAIEDYPEVWKKYDWNTVNYHIETGDYATYYNIGDTIPLDLGSKGIIDMQIAAFDEDDLADGSGKAHISFVAKNISETYKINNTLVKNDDGTYQEGTGSIGGWEKCMIRTYLNDTILPLIPENVSSMIKPVTKYSDSYDTSGTAVDSVVTTDSIWIPSAREMFGGTSYEQNGAIYTTLFIDNNSRIKRNNYNAAVQWWLRTAYTTNQRFCNVSSSGALTSTYPTSFLSLVIGFCI